MRKNTNTVASGFLLLVILLIGSCSRKKEAFPLHVIPLESTVGNYEILNLSDFATEIKYIPLETIDESLISPDKIETIYENGKILIFDIPSIGKENCYLFDNTGKFCCKIGHQGQGPDDYLHIDNVSMHDNLIFIMTWHKILVYDTAGRLVENINLKSDNIPEEYRVSSIREIILLRKDVFVANVASSRDYPTAFLFETVQSVVKTVKEYPASVKLDRAGRGFSSSELGIMCRFKDDVRIYKPINDTIFTIGQNKEIKDAFIFEFGKYKPPLSYYEWKGLDMEQHNYVMRNCIFPIAIYESFNHLFIKFDFWNHSPEPYETSFRGLQYTAFDVNGVFDKHTGELTLMRQPIKGKLGFINDIDGGPVIWPHYISSNNELVSFIQPDEFMDYYENIENPSAALKEIADKLQIDDNPIVIVAKLK